MTEDHGPWAEMGHYYQEPVAKYDRISCFSCEIYYSRAKDYLQGTSLVEENAKEDGTAVKLDWFCKNCSEYWLKHMLCIVRRTGLNKT